MLHAAVCTVCSVLLCLLLVSDDSPLTEPSRSMVARLAVGKFATTLCQAFVPNHCVWRSGCPGISPPHTPRLLLLLKHDNDKRGRTEALPKSSSESLACGARGIQCVPEKMSSLKMSTVSTIITLVCNCYSGLFVPHVQGTCTFLRLFLGS